MNIRSTYRVVSLSLILAFSLLFPYCVHADTMASPAHSKASSATDGHLPDCQCGHELVKEYQKNKEATPGHSLPFFPADILTDEVRFSNPANYSSRRYDGSSGIWNKSAPSIHLLNSVFLH